MISFFLLKPFIAIFTTLLGMSEYFSEEEDKAILRRNSKVKRKPRGMSNKMINKQKKLKKGKNHPEKTTADGQPTEIKITTFICPICYKELTTRSSKKFKRECLKTHILAEHTDSDLKFVGKFKNVYLPKIT
jgi:hypothetical protein